MISIIILHRNKKFLDAIIPNIEKTIGIKYELVIIDNQENKYNIFQGYNLGVKKSKGNILCFCHEDILFHTENWGENVINHFASNSKLGMLGVVGGNFYPKMPSPWWSNEEVNDHLVNIIQHWNTKEIPFKKYRKVIGKQISRDYNNPKELVSQKAIAVDGLWFCVKKDLFNHIFFDEKTYNGFHFYDADISLQIFNLGYQTEIIYNVLIEHFSSGSLTKEWFIFAEKFTNKWKDILPVSVKKIPNEKIIINEIKTLLTFIYWMQSANFTDKKLKNTIKKNFPLIKKNFKIKEFWQLFFWQYFGYEISRVPMFFINRIL